MSGDFMFPVIGEWRYSSPFGNRESPGGIGSTNHRGIDIAAAAGTPIVSSVSGTVEVAQSLRGYGNTVYIRDSEGNQHRFAHMQGFNVAAGQSVIAGQQIGAVGSTGNSTGPHLHYEVRDALGRVINPRRLLDEALSEARGLLDRGRDALGNLFSSDTVVAGANAVIPGSGSLLEGLGVVGDCDWFCQFKQWITESGFFQRVALGVLALILIAAAVAYLGRGELSGQLSKAMKG